MDKDLNIRYDSIKVLVENIDSKISNIPHRNIFANTSPRTKEIKKKLKMELPFDPVSPWLGIYSKNLRSPI